MKSISNFIISFKEPAVGVFLGDLKVAAYRRHARMYVLEIHLLFIHLRLGYIVYKRRW